MNGYNLPPPSTLNLATVLSVTPRLVVLRNTGLR
jgi:hypothetical protein